MRESGDTGQPRGAESHRISRGTEQPRRFRDHYDWVVVGDDPGALLSACLAAQLGLSVLMLSTGREVGAKVSKSGQIHDPESNWISGLGVAPHGDGLLRVCLQRLGMQPIEWTAVRNEAADLQLMTPQTRLRWGRSHFDLIGELERELGPDLIRHAPWLSVLESVEQALTAHWLEYPDRFTFRIPAGSKEQGPTAKRVQPKRVTNTERIIESHAKGPEFHSILSGLDQRKDELSKMGLGKQDFQDLSRASLWAILGVDHAWDSPAELLKALSLARTAAGFQGGRSGLKRLLSRLAIRFGVHSPQGRYCRRIFADRGRLTGVQISQSGNVIGATGLALGVSLDEAASLLSEEDRQCSALRPSQKVRGWVFTVAATLPYSSIPPGVSPRMVWGARNSPILSIEFASPQDYGAEPSERKLLFIRTELPFTRESLEPSFQRLTAARMLEQLDHILPGISARMLKMYPDCRAEDSMEWKDAHPFHALVDIPECLRIYEGNEGASCQSGIEGVFVATRESKPELGDFAATLAGLEATAWIAHRNGIAGPFG